MAMTVLVLFEQVAQDLRYGWRTLRDAPAFAATTVLTLAVGLALTTGVFTVFNAYVLRPYAVRDPAGLYQVLWHAQGAGGRSVRWRDYLAIRERQDLFTHALAESTRYVSYQGRPLAAELVSGSYFAALGPGMALGRPLVDADESGDAVVISHGVWAGRFARDPSVLGRAIEIDGRHFVIVGVVGPRFGGLHAMPRDIWIPVVSYASLTAADRLGEGSRPVNVSVRLRPGVTPQEAQSAVTPLLTDLAGHDRRAVAEIRPQDRPTPLTGRLLLVLSPVFAAFLLVLLAGCANVSSVMLARAVARQREIAVRLALGAGRGRIVRQLLTEGLLTSLLAAVVALALTAAGLRIGTAVFFETLPASLAAILRAAPLELDHRVFGFALAAAVVSTLAFALIPALQASRSALTGALSRQGGGGIRGAALRGVLVAGQVSIALLLVIPAITLARNGFALRGADIGFDTSEVVSVHVREGDQRRLSERLADVMAADPRVESVAVANGNPLFGPPTTVVLELSGTRVATPVNFVSAEYFATLRIPLVRGRTFRDDEGRTASRVAVVSAATARAFWPGQDPIGRTIRMVPVRETSGGDLAGYSDVTVVGMVGDVISGLIADGPEPGHVYLPTAPGQPQARSLLARARSEGDLAPEPLQQILRRVAADTEVFEALPLEDLRTLQVYPCMAASWMGSLLGVVALGLSISGLFGVLTFTLAQRTKEIGIRIALGATAGTVVRMVMRQTAWLAGLGAAVGVAGAFALLRILAATVRLPALSFLDAPAFAAGLALVVAAAAIATYRPARRAAQTDPAGALRADA